MLSSLHGDASLLLEAALRSALLALAVWIGLRVCTVRNVLAQKAAWGLVLVSALTMPLVLRLAIHLPAFVIPSEAIRPLVSRVFNQPQMLQVALAVPRGAGADRVRIEAVDKPRVDSRNWSLSKPEPAATVTPTWNRYPAPAISESSAHSAPSHERTALGSRNLSPLQIAVLIYLAVAVVLFVRLVCGSLAALEVWKSARPVRLDGSILARGLHLRASDAVSSPVTIGSGVVLPASFLDWDDEKLRIVLAHERSHVRQGDFYLQLLTSIYAALVWFSPLGWWLKRKLSDLAEAISDRAGLEEASDRTAYAQVLLEFAAGPRPTLIGVAMARSGSLSRRIERLLNDGSFRQAFAGTRRSIFMVLVIPLALLALTALVRVGAEGQALPSAPPPRGGVAGAVAVAPVAPSAPVEPPSPISMPEVPSAPGVPEPASLASESGVELTAPQAAPVAPAAPAEPPAVAIAPPSPPAAEFIMIAPKIAGPNKVLILPGESFSLHEPAMALITLQAGYGRGYGVGASQTTTTEDGTVVQRENGKRSGYRYSYSSDGDSYAIVRGDGSGQMSFNGDIHTSEIERARKLAHGDFLWFSHGGKSYFIDDPGTITQMEAMYKPMEELGRQQEELGKKQEALGREQEELGKKQEAASVPTPDMSKEIAEIDAAMAKLKASQGKNMTQDQFAEIQEKLGELQGKLGEIQGEIGTYQGKFGEQMGVLGAKMGELGAEQGRLGAEQGRIAQHADLKIKSIIDESLKNGKAHPVE